MDDDSHKISAFMIISQVTRYPIKSCKGIPCTSAQVERRGFQLDRRWMVTYEDGLLMTQRKVPKMALISVAIGPDHLAVNAPGMPELLVPFDPTKADVLQVQVWADIIPALHVGTAPSSWFSRFLGIPAKLVMMPESTVRPVNPRYAVAQDEVSFADAYPYLLLSEASVEDLNGRLESPLPMNRFRPNLVVKGCEPYEEDRWRVIQVGKITFHVVKPCSRCVLTTVDQDTGIKGEEPLYTLSTYRTRDNNVLFGQNLIATNTGAVTVGDRVEVLEWR